MPNPLNLSLATGLQNRTEKVKAEIVSLDELEEMSLAEVKKAQHDLEKRRQRLHLQIDKRKLDQTTKIMDSMDDILLVMAKKLKEDDVVAQDVRHLTDAYKNMLNSLNMISRLDSVDGTGNAAMLSIEVRYKGV